MRLAERNLRRHPGSYLLVRYEDLVRQTERTLREVCGFVGEPFLPEMLEMASASAHRDSLISGARRATAQRPLSAEFIGRFRGRVPPAEVAFMQLHAGRRMRRYGYELHQIGLPPRAWVRFGATTWPSNLARLVAWRGIEALQQRLPAVAGRKPDQRMILQAAAGGTG